MDGFDSIVCSTGPMCRSARDIDLFISAVRGTEPHLLDPSLFPLPWSPALPAAHPLKVGIMMHDGVVLPQPPMLRGMEWAKEKLSGVDGIELVVFKSFNHHRALEIIVRFFSFMHIILCSY
jgi:amidase